MKSRAENSDKKGSSERIIKVAISCLELFFIISIVRDQRNAVISSLAVGKDDDRRAVRGDRPGARPGGLEGGGHDDAAIERHDRIHAAGVQPTQPRLRGFDPREFSREIGGGRSGKGKLTGDAWERLPEPKPRLALELISKDGAITEYQLGPHEPRLRPEDLALLHQLWLEVTSEPQLSGLHHYDLVAIALEKLRQDLSSEERDRILDEMLENATVGSYPKLNIPKSRIN